MYSDVSVSAADPVNPQMSDASSLLVATLCSSLLIIVLLLSVVCLIYKRGWRMKSVKSSLTAVITLPPSAPQYDFSSDLPDVSSGYSGSGSGNVKPRLHQIHVKVKGKARITRTYLACDWFLFIDVKTVSSL